MNHQLAERIALTAALFFMATAASAQAVPQAPQPPKAQEAEAEAFESPPPLLMGDATQNLLAWQRSGEIASRTPRPIAGSVANRSYERYIKSFEHPIPEHLGSTVTKSKSGGGDSSSGGR
ncbi:hypothetical protein QFZ42_000235 [Variovorax paradoxus]|jgi:hypothetical protein|uniref:DUF3613 domain-containing protein n=1 Tax=Variovorax paradoxus TaxID=34073 RepID=UPI002794ABF9|nr:DUF3613 domain-containing protein [Variovorax paradoxus]MDQ0568401.1 hypothetical protein [Variovorax paradoxus]